ncbi:hypothetical protein [Paraburkholderia kirstenboschensis]|uniref:hypothetical protein n=1 Tax=Paraburkholderia kirstenboschensis TaxID=1245436 RepID=UPI000A985BAD|nr:hypothetical protein [Paraburkholderia kirstenboschensis]
MAADFLKVRKDKRLPPTLTAFDRMRSDGAKVGITFAQAVTYCAEKGHGGFYPDSYLKDLQPVQAGKQGNGFMSKQARAEAENRRNHPDMYNADGTAKVIQFDAPRLAIAQQRPALISYTQKDDDVGF